jgi:gallate decarboxylase subunit C
MSGEIFDLRSALAYLDAQGESLTHYDQTIDAKYAVANHYVAQSAGVPASTISRDENMVMYNKVAGHDMSVLIGLFGSRKRNQLLLTGKRESHHGAFFRAMAQPIKPIKKLKPVCQEVVIDKDIDLLKQLPILTLTPQCAGPYISLGLVLAKDPSSQALNASVHRLCVQAKDEMTISIFPGHHLGALYEAAMSKGQTLPISINLGLDPAVYYGACLTEPLCKKGECELDVIGGLRGRAVEISDCLTVSAECLSNAEIIIEAEITATQMPENKGDGSKGSMPEFLGYQGGIPPGLTCPVVKVKAITYRQNPIYQTVIGPGLEQSELLAITPELATRGFLQQHFKLEWKDIIYNTAGGGLLMAVLQIQKHAASDDALAVTAALKVLAMVPPLKHVFLVDEDVNPHSAEDLFWAFTTRFQSDIDIHTLINDKPFRMDPSQSPEYRKATDNKTASIKTLFDCTVPWEMKSRFKRPFV